MALAVRIELFSLKGVEVDGVRPGDGVEDEGNAHSLPRADVVCDVAENDGANGTTAYGRDEEGGTALGVPTETAEGKGKNYDGG
jgi:hypothetical protein